MISMTWIPNPAAETMCQLLKLLLSVLILCCRDVTRCDAAFLDHHDDRFMADVNLEHYYILEENALSKADLMLRGDFLQSDDEDLNEAELLSFAPNLTNFKSLVNETKQVHRLAGTNLPDFLAHPINVYHLLYRLATRWKAGINMLMEAELFKRWQVPAMVRRLQKLSDSLPGLAETTHVISYLAKLQRIHRIPSTDLASGKVKGMNSMKPLTLDEQMDIAKSLLDNDEMELALKWLQLIDDWLNRLDPAHGVELKSLKIKVYNMQASAHSYLKNMDLALEATQRILDIDPLCGVAKENVKFFQRKLDTARQTADLHPGWRGVKMTKYEKLCSRKSPRMISKKTCRVIQVGLRFYKMETIRSRPTVVLFHHVISDTALGVLKDYAHNKQRDQAWSTKDKFHSPSINIELVLSKLTRAHARREMRHVQKHLTRLARLMVNRSASWAGLQVINVGLEGMHLSRHAKRLQLIPHRAKYRKSQVGAFLVFLNSAKAGGQAVLEKLKISVTPEKGSVLFYAASETRPNSFCPVIGESLWVALQPIYESPKDFCEKKDEWK